MNQTLINNTQQVAALATCLLLATAHERRVWRGHRNGAMGILRACRRGSPAPDAVTWLARALWEIEEAGREWESNGEWEGER